MGKSGHAPKILWGVYALVGVQIFFVISGFLITGLLIEEHTQTGTISLKMFYARRACRILPAAFVFILIAKIFFWPEVAFVHLIAAIFYVANFDNLRPWIFGHLWSLGVEEQFYFLWPGLLRWAYSKRLALLITVITLTPFIQVLLYFAKVRGGNIGAYPWSASNLAFGCLLAVLSPRLPKIRPALALLMTLAIIFIPLFAGNTALKTLLQVFFLQPVFYASLAGVLLHVIQTPYEFLNWGPVVWLGKISYSLYLWQEPFCADPSLKHGYYAVFAFMAACLSYYFVERPVLKWRDRRVVTITNKNNLKASALAT